MMELDGNPVTVDQLAVLALAPYGHFATMRVDDQHVRGLASHLRRLRHDCRALFDAELDLEKVRGYLRRVIADVRGSVLVRVTVFDPSLQLGRPGDKASPHVLITTRPAPPLASPPMRVQTVKYRREDAAIKHVGLYGAIRQRRIAQRNGFDDVLFTDDGYVLEGATWNIGFFDGERVVWPEGDILDGVTSRLLADVYRETVTIPVHIDDLPKMRAAFATNTAIGVSPISTINDICFPAEHHIIGVLQSRYSEIVADRV